MMAVCMIMPQSIHLTTGVKLDFIPLKSIDGLGGCVVDVHHDGAIWRVLFTPGGQVMRVRRLTDQEAAAKG